MQDAQEIGSDDVKLQKIAEQWRQIRGTRTWLVVSSLLIALISFLVSFITFFAGYIIRAERLYPKHNSMAGLPAFYFGLPVGVLASIITTGVWLLWQWRNIKQDATP
jgi:hypothetical protein